MHLVAERRSVAAGVEMGARERRSWLAGKTGNLSPEECRRTGLTAGTNEITIEDLVGAMLTHDSEHLD
jgi:hypothetical protein